MFAVLSIALPVFGLILTGAVAGRGGWLGRDATGALNMFVVYLALPAVLIQAMAHIRPADLANGGLLGAFGLGIVLPFAATLLLARRRSPLGDSALQALAATFCNVGYMGIPLCRMAFGEASLVPSVITMVITACPQIAATIVLVELDRPGQPGLGRVALRVGRVLVRNPLLISPLIGFAIALSGVALPLVIDRFLTLLGAAATPCALVATGLILTETTERFRLSLVSRLVVVKLLVQPAIVWVIAYHLVNLPTVWAQTAVMMAALPTGSSAFILAKLYGRQAAATSGTILLSTILSFPTLSVLLVWLT